MRLTFEGPSNEIDTIIYTLRDEINKCDMHILECMHKNDLNYLKWWQLHKEYLSSIVKKIVVDKE